MLSNLRTEAQLAKINRLIVKMDDYERAVYRDSLDVFQGPSPAPINVFELKKNKNKAQCDTREEMVEILDSVSNDAFFIPDLNFLSIKYLKSKTVPGPGAFKNRLVSVSFISQMDEVTGGRISDVLRLSVDFACQLSIKPDLDSFHLIDQTDCIFSLVAARHSSYNVHGIYSLSWYECPLTIQLFLIESFQYVIGTKTRANDLPDIMLIFHQLARLFLYSNDLREWDFGNYKKMLTDYINDNKDYGCYYNINYMEEYATICSERLSARENDEHESLFESDVFCPLADAMDIFRRLPDNIYNSDQRLEYENYGESAKLVAFVSEAFLS